MEHCIDFALPEGTPVRSIGEGKVLSRESRYGKTYKNFRYASRVNHVGILYPDGKTSFYVHLAWRSVKVSRGQKVKRGQVVGLSGETGYATYPHLHLGLYDANGKNIPNTICRLKPAFLVYILGAMLILYTKTGCPFCARVLSYLMEKGISLEERNIADPKNLAELMEKGGKRQVPFFVDTKAGVSMYESGDIITYLNGLRKS